MPIQGIAEPLQVSQFTIEPRPVVNESTIIQGETHDTSNPLLEEEYAKDFARANKNEQARLLKGLGKEPAQLEKLKGYLLVLSRDKTRPELAARAAAALESIAASAAPSGASGDSELLVRNAQRLLEMSYDYHGEPGKKVLVICDTPKKESADAFIAAIRRMGGDPKIIVLGPDRFGKGSLEGLLAEVKKGYALCINLFEGRTEETPVRVKLVNAQEEVAKQTKGRIAHGPGFSLFMLRNIPDLAKAQEISDRFLDIVKDAQSVHITCPAGTDLTMGVRGREPHPDLKLPEGRMGNIPGGEIFWAAEETKTSGTVISYGPVEFLGFPPMTLKLDFKNGHLDRVGYLDPESKFGDPAFLDKLNKKLAYDSESRTIGELGIGLLDVPAYIGNTLFDEKITGVHVAVGNNKEDGGENKSDMHIDFIIRNVTVTVSYTKESGKTDRTIIVDGKLQLDK